MSQTTKRQPREFTGKHMLMSILAFFGVIIAVNLTLAYFAVGSWTGLIVKSSYVASQDFNDVLAAAEAQDALGWTSTAFYEDGMLTFELNDAQGKPLYGYQVDAAVERPIHENEDHALVLQRVAGGPYQASVDLMPGAWVAKIVATGADGRLYRQDFRLWVPQDG